jgi:hypothetical protein
MYRSLRSVVAAVAGAGFIGCAMSGPADLTPDINPGLPGLDAGSNPVPGRPGAEGADAGADASASNGNSSADGGAKSAFADDAAAADPASSLPKPAAGEILITEIMYSTFTPEPASEWIEIYSKAASPCSLRTCCAPTRRTRRARWSGRRR